MTIEPLPDTEIVGDFPNLLGTLCSTTGHSIMLERFGFSEPIALPRVSVSSVLGSINVLF